MASSHTLDQLDTCFDDTHAIDEDAWVQIGYPDGGVAQVAETRYRGDRLIVRRTRLIGGLLDAQPLGQRGRQQRPRVGDRVGVVEARVELVEGVGGCHREPALLMGEHGSFGKRHSPSSGGLSHNRVGTISIAGTVHPG